jgi:hypothetical protein
MLLLKAAKHRIQFTASRQCNQKKSYSVTIKTKIDMPFIKGDTRINTKGRAAGVQNKKTHELKSLLVTLFESNLSEILLRYDELTLNERLALNRTLLPYVLPSIKVINHNTNLEPSIWDNVKL